MLPVCKSNPPFSISFFASSSLLSASLSSSSFCSSSFFPFSSFTEASASSAFFLSYNAFDIACLIFLAARSVFLWSKTASALIIASSSSSGDKPVFPLLRFLSDFSAAVISSVVATIPISESVSLVFASLSCFFASS